MAWEGNERREDGDIEKILIRIDERLKNHLENFEKHIQDNEHVKAAHYKLERQFNELNQAGCKLHKCLNHKVDNQSADVNKRLSSFRNWMVVGFMALGVLIAAMRLMK